MGAPQDLSKRFAEGCAKEWRLWRCVQHHWIVQCKLAISPQNWHITRMAKSKSYSCSDCGAVTNKWSGRCDSCEAWNTISEDTALSSGPSKTSLGAKKGSPVQLSNLDTDEAPIHAHRAELTSLTAFWAAASCQPLPFWWGEIQVSENQRFCCKRRRNLHITD